MSVYAYTGLPGSGKSYSVVEHQILPAIKSGRKVVTNVALRFDLLRVEFPGVELVEFPTPKVAADPASIYDYVTPGSVLVLDEVWRIFPAGLKANHVPEPFRKLLAEHRHMVDAAGNTCQIVLVTQDLAQISAFARQLVEQTFRSVKLSSVGMQKQYRVDVYNGAATGPNPPENARIRQIFGQFKSDVWKYYRTHTLAETSDREGKANEKAIDGRANILKRPAMVVGAVAAVALIVFGFTSLAGLFHDEVEGPPGAAAVAADDGGPPPRQVKALSIGDPVKNVVSSVKSVATGSVKSGLRLVGFIDNLDEPAKSLVLLHDGSRVIARPLLYCSNHRGWLECDFPDLGPLSL